MLNRELIEKIKSKSKKKGQKKEKLLKLKDEIIALRNEGLTLSQIVEYLKEAHGIKVTPEYLRKLIPEIKSSSKVEYVYKLLDTMTDEEVAEVFKKLGKERLNRIRNIYQQKREKKSHYQDYKDFM
jgi:RNA recognition motif-containing protein